MDEAHHVLTSNKWGTAVAMLPNARGLGVTATPLRADGKGLGRHADGVFDTMIVGVNMRELIEAGYLSDYRAYAPPSDLDLSDVNITASGEYNKTKLKGAVVRSHIVGDVVEHYLRLARGKLGVTFATDVETAGVISARFNASGVPSAVIHAKTPERERIGIMKRFKRHELLQIVNVDILGEGVDVPAIEVVSMARPTQSFGLFVQQFGRALRPLAGKSHAIIIDHAGNIVRHGLPDGAKIWTLDRREKRKTTDNGAIPVRSCMICASVYERTYTACPFCGHVNIPTSRSTPEQVDGDLVELTPEAIAILRGEVARVDMHPAERAQELRRKNVPHIGILGTVNKHIARQSAQGELRASIAMWAGVQRYNGRPDRESYKKFYFLFGVDVMSAQALNEKDATILTERVNRETRT
jgi:superfamily II DNA or RNA helicase